MRRFKTKKRRSKIKNIKLFIVSVILALVIFFCIITLAIKIFGLLNHKSRHKSACDYPQQQTVETAPRVPYNGRIEHIFFHPLVAYPDLAFDGDRMSKGFDDWFVTADEFSKVIQSLYDNNFILVGPDAFYEEKDGKLEKKTLMLPEGKKPVLISLDDMNYYTYMIENGTVSRLVLDENGNVAALCNENGNEVIRRDNCIIPLLDDFVKMHPDFSLDGAKACIGLTGFEGILGYRTQADSPNRDSECEAVKPIIARLRATNWTFASHSYTHLDVSKASTEKLEYDCNKWKEEVEPLVGETTCYLYPYGSGVSPSSQQYQILKSIGFRFFNRVGVESYIEYYGDSVQMDRRHVDGIAFRLQRSRNLDLYDADAVINRAERKS